MGARATGTDVTADGPVYRSPVGTVAHSGTTPRVPMAGFVLSLLGLLAMGALGVRSASAGDAMAAWVEHTHEVLAGLAQLDVAVLLANGRRNELSLTFDPTLLAATRAALESEDAARARVRSLTADNPSQQARVDELALLLAANKVEVESAVAARSGHFEAEAERVGVRARPSTTDALRAKIELMSAEERSLLGARLGAWRARVARSRATLAAGALGSLLLLCAALALLVRDNRVRARGEGWLRAWRNIFRYARWGVGTSAADGSALTLSNPALAAMHGATDAELVGRPLADLAPPAERDAMSRAIDAARTHGHHSFEATHVRRDGTTFPVAIELSRLDADGSSAAGLVINVQDITARKRAERERDRLFEISTDMIAIANLEGQLTRVNPSFGAVLGYTVNELVSRPFLEFVHPGDREATLRETEKLATGALTIGFENRYMCKDGSFRWLQWTATPDLADGILYAIARDATASKEAAAKIAALNAELAERVRAVTAVNQELESFSYSVSHDLRARRCGASMGSASRSSRTTAPRSTPPPRTTSAASVRRRSAWVS